MEVAAAASAVDFHALSRRELQALCKRNGIRANMTNAAMADALQGLGSVDGVDEIGTTLCLPTPGRSAMKSAAKAAAATGEEQQHGSPLPRGRRVSVMSPAAIQMDVMEGDDELKQDLIKEIVKTPGVALRGTSRRARATPAPLPTPATLRRSTRTAARKAAVAVEAENLVEEEVSTVKRTTRRASSRKKIIADLDQESEEMAATAKVQQEEPKDVASDVKCDDPEEEEFEVTKQLGGDNKVELEEGEEADSSDAVREPALISDKNNDDLKVEEVVSVVELETSKLQEAVNTLSKAESKESVVEKRQLTEGASAEGSPVDEMTYESSLAVHDKAVAVEEEVVKEDGVTVTGIVSERQQISAENSSPIEPMEEDSPILGVLSKTDSKESVVEKRELTEGASDKNEGAAESSPVDEMTYESSLPVDDKAVAVEEEVVKEDSVTVTGGALRLTEEILPSAETTEEKEVDVEAAKDGTTEEDEFDEDEEWSSDDDDETSEEIDSTHDSDEENDDTNEERDFNEEELVQMMPTTALNQVATDDSVEGDSEYDSTEESSEDDSAEEDASEAGDVEEDDFTSDLPSEFDDIVIVSDAETESDNTAPVLEENQVAAASATKTAVRSLDDSNEEEVTVEKDASEEATKKGASTLDTIVKSLDEFTIKDEVKDYYSMSLRKLKSEFKSKSVLVAKGDKKHADGKRLPLEEVDDNASLGC